MKDIDWSKAPEGATHAYVHGDEKITWYKDIKKNSYSFRRDSRDTWTVYEDKGVENRPVWHPLIPRPTPWQGPQDGLPPVGGTHEDADLFGLGYSKPKYDVVAHHYNGVTAIVSVQTEDGIQYRPAKAPHFRPVQSERDALAKIISKAIDTYFDDCADAADQVISAGYRKQMSRAEAFEALNTKTIFSDERITMALDALGYKD